MYRISLLLLLGLLHCLVAQPAYDDPDDLNLSHSCPNTTCILWLLKSDFQKPMRYTGTQVIHLEELLLFDCQLRALPVELLRLTPNLRILLVQNSSVYHVNKEDFQATPQLTQLMLQRNHISRLKEQQFATLQQLDVLELGHNIIQSVHAQAFAGLGKLRVLALQGNGITQLMEGALEPLSNLLHLDLSGNEISDISQKTFATNNKLQTLLLNGNQLTQFDSYSLLGLANLRLLELSNCGQLVELQLHGVQHLRLENNRVSKLIINDSVISLQAGNNALTQLSIGDKSAVIELDLHGNLLNGSVASTLIEGMWNLQTLDLSKNNIESLYSDGLSLLLPSLSHLNLAHNQLSSLPSKMPLLPNRLVELDLSHNHMIRVYAENFAALPSLQRLYIEGMNVEQFDYRLFHQHHPNLQELGICDNEGSRSFIHKMVIYLTDRGVHLPGSCLNRVDTKTLSQLIPAVDAQPQTLGEVGGIHPYWTTRDVLAFLTLIVVFIILLMQLYRILEEEGWLRRMQQWLWVRQPTVVNGTRARRLNEDDSENSSE